jgi:hypothetical protein
LKLAILDNSENHLNPYAVRENYLDRASYSENKCKSRSMEVIDKIVNPTLG